MAKKQKHNMTPEEAEALFSELDASGVLDPAWKTKGKNKKKKPAAQKPIDPLSDDDPSGSRVGKTISHTAGFVLLGIFVLIIGLQLVYGVGRRLNTANLSERANDETVAHAMKSGIEWGDGFTQFPREFEVDEASEKTGTIEVSVVDTDSKTELELLSSSQIQASALATNALLNEKINRVIYTVYVLEDENGNIQHDSLFSFLRAKGTRRAMLTFVWTKAQSEDSADINWELKIIGMDSDLVNAIQKQVNSVSSLTEGPGLTQDELDEERELSDQTVTLVEPSSKEQ